MTASRPPKSAGAAGSSTFRLNGRTEEPAKAPSWIKLKGHTYKVTTHPKVRKKMPGGVKILGRTLKERSVHHTVTSPQSQVAGVSSKPDGSVSSSLWSDFKSTVKLLVILLRTKSFASVRSVKALENSPVPKPGLGGGAQRGGQAKSGLLKRKVNGLLQQLVKTAVNKLVIAEGRDMSLAGEVANCPVAVVVRELARLPDTQRIKVLGCILEYLREEACDNVKAVDLVTQLMRQPGIDPSIHKADLTMSVCHGMPHENAVTAKHLFDVGMLDIGHLAVIGGNNTQLLGGMEMIERPGAQRLIDNLDLEKVKKTESWKVVTAQGVVGTAESDGSPAFKLKVAAQANVVTINRLLEAGGDNPAFRMMVMAWDRMVMKDMNEYNASIPPEKRELKLDIADPAFIEGLSRLNSEYFKKLEGGPLLLGATSWNALPDGWQNNPDITPTREEVISDFFARRAPGILRLS